MHIILCIDDNGGMLFNGRRQSQDRVLREDILRSAAGKRLYMNGYSKKLFGESGNICVDEQFLEKAGPGDCCFVENLPVAPHIGRAESITVYKWNRVYPADLYFDVLLAAPQWRQIERTEFAGSSHERITKEVYVR